MHLAYRTLADWFDNFIHHSEFLFSVEKAASLLFIPCVVSLLGFSHSGNVVALVESSHKKLRGSAVFNPGLQERIPTGSFQSAPKAYNG